MPMYSGLHWFVEVQGSHNPLVAGSSPACPTFSTHTSEWVFTHYANVAKTSFYAIFTQSATTDQHNSKQYLFLSTDFSEIFSYLFIFSWEQWEFWEHDLFAVHFQLLTDHLIVPLEFGLISLANAREISSNEWGNTMQLGNKK